MPGTIIVPPQVSDQSVIYSDTSSKNVEFWSSYLVPRFQMYISEAGSYTAGQQAAHTSCLRTALESLGPKPPHPYMKPALTYNSVPFELSINLSEDRAPTARFYFEPLGSKTGTDEDPFGEACIPSTFSRLATQMTSMDTRWYQQLRQVFDLKNQEERDTAKARSRPGVWLPMAFMGVDFVGANRILKCTFCPLLKFFATGGGWDNLADVNKMVLEAVRQLPEGVPAMGEALDMLGQYLLQESVDDGREDMRCRACAAANRPTPFINLVSVDCTDPTSGKGRVKLYTRVQCTAFACIRDAVTLGGRLTDEETLEGLRRLQSVWHMLLNDPACEHNADYSRPVAVEQLRRGIDINWEISGRLSVPQAKVYVPVYLFHANDLEVNRNLNSVFRKLNWHEWAEGRYEGMLRRVLYEILRASLVFRIRTNIIYSPEADFSTSRINTWVSFSYYQQRGSYMTMYHTLPL